MMLTLYSLMLVAALTVSAPWWLYRMATTGRYREGLGQRLGRIPVALLEAVRGRKVVWVHAVSVGEALAATRLVGELEAALGEGFRVVVSTTTRTGQALARERFGAERVFYMPLDFAWAVRRYLRALRPAALVLMESELWPRVLYECSRAGVPVAVVNARVSDRTFARRKWAPAIWTGTLRRVNLWMAQTEEDARRLAAMGARKDAVRVGGNLKYDVRAPRESRVAELIREVAAGRPVVVAGSTVARLNDKKLSEDEMAIQAWEGMVRRELEALLVLAPRHPERFGEVEAVAMEFSYALARDWMAAEEGTPPFAKNAKDGPPNFVQGRKGALDIVVLDTIGDLAAVYGVADVAFVGGSLVKRGGHNPLEPAQFGVPVVMGPSFENFRDIVGKMIDADAIRIVKDEMELEIAFRELLTNRESAKARGERGRRVFEQEQGATGRAVEAVVEMVRAGVAI
ncbi:MAG TPA: 3-deoxy-D-manno-octulosonic acid transferase [Acidobacteriaceae bacterium]